MHHYWETFWEHHNVGQQIINLLSLNIYDLYNITFELDVISQIAQRLQGFSHGHQRVREGWNKEGLWYPLYKISCSSRNQNRIESYLISTKDDHDVLKCRAFMSDKV